MGELQLLNEQAAAEAFSAQSLLFDQYDAGNGIIAYKRARVRTVVMELLKPGSRILELNAGTGLDATWFARHGHRVHATDIAEGMLERLREKVRVQGLEDKVKTERCSFTRLEELGEKGPYDMVFSNFAGLNCTGELYRTLGQLGGLVRPGGHVVLVLLPGFCLWESLLVFKGKWRTAFRRWWKAGGAAARVEGYRFRCWYYSPGYVRKRLEADFELSGIEGLCTLVPPSYMEHFAERYPKGFGILRGLEDRWKRSWPWRSIGDYYIISLRRKEG